MVSLAVPESFDKLLTTLSGIPAFAASFGLLAYIWYAQYTYFRRYDFEDAWVVVLNLVLLFVVLVYVYPLKFLYAAVFNSVELRPGQVTELFMIYGAGFAAVFLLLALLYLHAYRSRASLALSPLESYRHVRRSGFTWRRRRSESCPPSSPSETRTWRDSLISSSRHPRRWRARWSAAGAEDKTRKPAPSL